MAGTTVSGRSNAMQGSAELLTRLQFNKLVADVETLRSALSAGGVVAVLELMDDHATNKTLMDELKTDYTALLADVTAIRVEVLALVADMATRIANHNTLATKLNADGGVTDADYAAAGAITAVNPASLTATAIAASSAATLTATAPSGTVVDTAGDMTAALVANESGSTTT